MAIIGGYELKKRPVEATRVLVADRGVVVSDATRRVVVDEVEPKD
ncbi:hypothetical protein [Halorubellus litoreus]|uniref:Uncharacterized protein n=1 Tax=Halorubellus litoreus TaxID=755308 RepID=A0ABD5VJ75_9EURY